jgi:hypothetical protein
MGLYFGDFAVSEVAVGNVKKSCYDLRTEKEYGAIFDCVQSGGFTGTEETGAGI